MLLLQRDTIAGHRHLDGCGTGRGDWGDSTGAGSGLGKYNAFTGDGFSFGNCAGIAVLFGGRHGNGRGNGYGATAGGDGRSGAVSKLLGGDGIPLPQLILMESARASCTC